MVEERSGILSLIKMSTKESDLFRDYLRLGSSTPAYDFIYHLIGEDYIKFMDLLAGTNIKISSRRSIYRDIEYIKIYNYVKEHDFSLHSVKSAAKIYNKKLSFVRRAIARVSKTVDGEVHPCADRKGK